MIIHDDILNWNKKIYKAKEVVNERKSKRKIGAVSISTIMMPITPNTVIKSEILLVNPEYQKDNIPQMSIIDRTNLLVILLYKNAT